MNKIYYLGNPLVRIDKIPTELIPFVKKKLRNIDFFHFDPTETLEKYTSTLFVIDSVLGIEDVTVFEDINSFVKSPRFSVHDYDLMSDAAILLKLKKIHKVIIIGIPAIGNIEDFSEKVVKHIRKFTSHPTSL